MVLHDTIAWCPNCDENHGYDFEDGEAVCGKCGSVCPDFPMPTGVSFYDSEQ